MLAMCPTHHKRANMSTGSLVHTGKPVTFDLHLHTPGQLKGLVLRNPFILE